MFTLVVFGLFLCLSAACLLNVDPRHPCRAVGNDTLVDLTRFLDFPLVGESGAYRYEWDCQGLKTSCGEGVTVCQSSLQRTNNRYEAGGSPKNALWMADSYNPNMQHVQLMYPSDFLRISVISLVLGDKNSNTSFVAKGELVPQQYYFDVVIPFHKR